MGSPECCRVLLPICIRRSHAPWQRAYVAFAALAVAKDSQDMRHPTDERLQHRPAPPNRSRTEITTRHAVAQRQRPEKRWKMVRSAPARRNASQVRPTGPARRTALKQPATAAAPPDHGPKTQAKDSGRIPPCAIAAFARRRGARLRPPGRSLGAMQAAPSKPWPILRGPDPSAARRADPDRVSQGYAMTGPKDHQDVKNRRWMKMVARGGLEPPTLRL